MFFEFFSTLSSFSITLPDCIGSSPLMHLSRVLLPQPLGPMITSTSPFLTLKSMPSSILFSPNSFVKFSIFNIVSAIIKYSTYLLFIPNFFKMP